jgi:hypothetical protein
MHINVSFGVAPPQSNSGSRALSGHSCDVHTVLYTRRPQRKANLLCRLELQTQTAVMRLRRIPTNLVEASSIIFSHKKTPMICPTPGSWLQKMLEPCFLHNRYLSSRRREGQLCDSARTRQCRSSVARRLFSLTFHSSNKDHQTQSKTLKKFRRVDVILVLSGHNTRSLRPMGGPSTDGDLVGDFCRRNLPLVPDLHTSQALSASMASATRHIYRSERCFGYLWLFVDSQDDENFRRHETDSVLLT